FVPKRVMGVVPEDARPPVGSQAGGRWVQQHLRRELRRGQHQSHRLSASEYTHDSVVPGGIGGTLGLFWGNAGSGRTGVGLVHFCPTNNWQTPKVNGVIRGATKPASCINSANALGAGKAAMD